MKFGERSLSKGSPWHRWMVADWKECENVDSTKRVRRRVVHCVKTFGEGEGESEIVPDEECPPPKPEEEEPCDPRHKRDLGTREVAMFSSARVKFGSQKKYDEYLKNFNAIATPERRSETIPLHIVNTPHFRHYYRVLQASEKAGKGSKSKVDLSRSQINQNTYSGNQQLEKICSRCCKRRTLFFPGRYRGERTRKKYRKYGKIGEAAVKPKLYYRRFCRRKRRKAAQRELDLGGNSDTYGTQDGDSQNAVNRSTQNYTIRFGQVMIDNDEDMNLSIILEEGERDKLMGVEGLQSPDRERMWEIRNDEAIQFLRNITGKDWKNRTGSED